MTSLIYPEFAMQESLLSCTEFMNDKIVKHRVRQVRSTWILELITRNLTSLIYYIYAENNYNDHRKEEKQWQKLILFQVF